MPSSISEDAHVVNEVGHRGSAAEALTAIGERIVGKKEISCAYKMYQQASTIQHEIPAVPGSTLGFHAQFRAE